jgi:hypothetical protein
MSDFPYPCQLGDIFPIGKTESRIASDGYLYLSERCLKRIKVIVRTIRQGIRTWEIPAATAEEAIDIDSLYEDAAEITMRTDIVFELPWVGIGDAIADDDCYPCLSDEYEEERLNG